MRVLLAELVVEEKVGNRGAHQTQSRRGRRRGKQKSRASLEALQLKRRASASGRGGLHLPQVLHFAIVLLSFFVLADIFQIESLRHLFLKIHVGRSGTDWFLHLCNGRLD